MNVSKKSSYRYMALAFCSLVIMAMATGAWAMDVGVGESAAKDPQAAGAQAAQQAKKALGETKPKLVLVYHSSDLHDDCEAMLKGITSVFDAGIVYGCSGYAPLTARGADARVAVLALGGDVKVTTAVAPTAGEADDQACGRKIGKALKRSPQTDAAGRIVLLFGDCHVPRDDTVVKGVSSVLGPAVPVVGGAAWNGRSYAAGKMIEGSNIGILITGKFRCGLSLKQDNSPDGLISSARAAFKESVGADIEKVALTFVFDCGGRRGKMLDVGNFRKEVEAMKEIAGDTPIFGFYGSGEIGCKSRGAAPQGVGFHISTAAIKKR